MKIAVLAGGFSPERDVSLCSGALIASALCARGHSVAYTDVYKSIDENEIPKMFRTNAEYSYKIPQTPPDLLRLKEKYGDGDRLIGHGVLSLCKQADVVFLALHGGMGEDGRIQATLSSLGIRHTGSDFTSCHLAMDKALSKAVFEASGIPTPEWILWDGAGSPDFPLPCVVKPSGCGSSVGVSIANTRGELTKALEKAARFDCKVIIERKISGREFSVGILDGISLPAIEIRPKKGFYDYKNKYQAGATEEICPAPLEKDEAELLGSLALSAHGALGLGAYSRLDFLIEEESGKFYCLEANALPGMTPSSLLPQEAAAVGIEYGELCEKIVLAAV